jgi:hypothetical protein
MDRDQHRHATWAAAISLREQTQRSPTRRVLAGFYVCSRDMTSANSQSRYNASERS